MTTLGMVGKYELRHQVGRGAMGVVYEAYDTVIERRVALKMLRTDVYAPEQLPDVRARFKREAHSAGRLSHPNIVTIFDYGEHEGAPFIAMDFMEGEELARSLESGARMALPQVARLMEQILAALAYAHDRGVVHRDIKPSNIFVLRDGTLKIVDFGLARTEASNLTETGTLLGTPAYMSPEQFLGLPVDARSDLFSIGVMLYQMLTGDRPFSGSPSTIMQKVLRQDPVEPSVLNPTLSAAWDTLVKRALAKKPADRLQSAREFSEYIHLVLQGKPLPAGAELPEDATVRIDATVRLAPPQPAPQRKSSLAAFAAAGVLASAAAAAGWFYFRPVPAPATPPPTAPVAAVQAPAPPVPAIAPEPPKPAPKPRPEKRVKAERPAAKPKREERVEPAPQPPPAAATVVAKVEKPAPPPTQPARAGKVVSLDRNWGFLVVQSPDPNVKVGDRLYANLADGRRVAIVVRRISGNLVSAVPEGQKASDDMVGASVTSR
jgi:serine/threonine-protein kinase